MKSSATKVANFIRDLPTTASSGLRTFSVAINPRDISQFFFGTDVGVIISIQRGQKTAPKIFPHFSANLSGNLQLNNCVAKFIQFHPIKPQYFLSGYSDGVLQIFSSDCQRPLISLETFSEVLDICWSNVCSFVFFALCKDALYVFDLRRRTITFEAKCDFGDSGTRALSMSMSGPKSFTKQPELAISFADGHVEIHMLSTKYNPKGQDAENFEFLMSGYRTNVSDKQ